MTSETIWYLIVANVVMAFATITNSWALAIYAKRKEKQRKEPEQGKPKGASKALLIARILTVTLLITGIVSVSRAVLNETDDAFARSLLASLGLFSIALSAALSLVNVIVGLLDRLLKVQDKIIRNLEGMLGASERQLGLTTSLAGETNNLAAVVAVLDLDEHQVQAINQVRDALGRFEGTEEGE